MDENLYDPLGSDKSSDFVKVPNKRIRVSDTARKPQENQTFIDTPLSESFKKYIRKIINKEDVDSLIVIIENVAEIFVGSDLYKTLLEKLSPVYEDESEAKKIVGKILFYKTKQCKMGINCENITDCVFIHDISKEVVINHVPLHLSEKLEKHCSNFGTVTTIKKMNPHKYLVVFENENDALEFIKDRETILGDDQIKKFFNRKRSNLNSLMAEQDELVKSLFEQGNKKLAIKMRIGLKKIRDTISEM